MVLPPSLEIPLEDGGLKALLKSTSLISSLGTFCRHAASHAAVKASTTSADSVFVLGGMMNIKWAIDAVSTSIYLHRLYSLSFLVVVCAAGLFLHRTR